LLTLAIDNHLVLSGVIKSIGSTGAEFDPNKLGVINVDHGKKNCLGTRRAVENKVAFKTDVAILAIQPSLATLSA
jgi:hypothetical protein